MLKFLALNDFFSPLYEKKPILQGEFEDFKHTFATYKANLNANAEQNEDALVANALAPFLQGLQFKTSIKAKQEGKSEVDLILLKNGEISVLVEAKKPENSKEFFSPQNVNCKALAECILYYLRQRNADGGGGFNYENLGSKSPNSSIKFIIITNFYDFYIFKAREFERLFATNKHFITLYANFTNPNSLFKGNTDEFYKETSKLLNSPEYLKSISQDAHEKPSLKGFHLNLKPILAQDKADFKSLKPIFKAFHKDFLFDEFNPNDANSLNSAFYEELLYILGLCEVKESSKLLIKPSSQSANTLYNAILAKLSQDKQDFERVMSFVVLWLNRILFLKLIEANLVRFNDDESLKFLNPNKVRNFKALSQLFFEILAKKPKDRANSTLDYLPYLNSALFQKQAIEREILDISALDDSATLPYFAKTQIKDKNAKKKAGSVPLLVYIFEFLDAFDFGSDEKSPELALQKELISSSVLGLVFEKLNGYKEGSFYTPSFITSYMCRASLEKVVLSKFNDKFKWQCENLKALRERIDRDFSTKAQEFKAVLNSIRICDPAVGSGHFLVSALNEMIAIYHTLGLAQRLNPCELALLSDELVITKPNGEIYAYKKPKIKNDESHAIQKALFTLKKQIIENNLFGVDINENSCEITKLRLWIELLKNSYYLQKDDEGFDENLNDEIHQMQTLPNIDINIKCGNSLISRFTLKDNFADKDIKKQVKDYKALVFDYKNTNKANFKISKNELETKIKALKQGFALSLADFKTKNALEKALETHFGYYGDFLLDDKRLFSGLALQSRLAYDDINLDEKTQEKAVASFAKIKLLRTKLDTALSGESYKNAFEWRFEFPEVLNENGEFMGFDLVVGNPPYISTLDLSKSNTQSKDIYRKTYPNISGLYDIYLLFVLLGLKLRAKNGCFAWIIPNKFLVAKYAKNTLDMLIKEKLLGHCIDVSNVNTFDNASVYPIIVLGGNNAKFERFFIEMQDDLLAQNLKQIKFIDWDRFKTFAEFGLKIQSGLAGFQAQSIVEFLSNASDKKENSIPFAVSGSIDRYLINTNLVKYMKHTYKNPQIAPNNAVSTEKWKFWCNEKIVIAGMTKQLEACYIKTPLAIGVGIYAIYDFMGLNPLLILGILNSKFMNYVFTHKFKDKHLAGGYLGINKNNLETLPIFEFSDKSKNLINEVVNLVNQILEIKKENSQTDTTKIEKDIDNLIYKLYNLDTNEIKIIERA